MGYRRHQFDLVIVLLGRSAIVRSTPNDVSSFVIRSHSPLANVHEMLLPFLEIRNVRYPFTPSGVVNLYGTHLFLRKSSTQSMDEESDDRGCKSLPLINIRMWLISFLRIGKKCGRSKVKCSLSSGGTMRSTGYMTSRTQESSMTSQQTSTFC